MLNTLFALTPQFIDGLNQLVWSNWLNTATTVLVVYDWLITLDVEIQLVWLRSGWSHTKIAYLVNRYLVIVDIILLYSRSYIVHPEACKSIFEAGGVLYLLGVIVSEYLITLRVCAVWKMNKIILAILAMTLTIGSIYALITNFLVKHQLVFFTILPFRGCFANLHDLTLWGSFILILGYDIVVLALMVYPTIKGYTRPYQRTVLVERIHVEGVLFYVYFVVVDLVTVIIGVALRLSVLHGRSFSAIYISVPSRVAYSRIFKRFSQREYNGQNSDERIEIRVKKKTSC